MVSPDTLPSQTPAEMLTSLPPSEAEVVNPKHWHELAQMYFSGARKEHAELSGLLIDIDATKAANDELGHAAGNQLIDMVEEITALIPHQVRHDAIKGGGRPIDVVTSRSSEPPELNIPGLELPEPQTARIGGDEFGILLPRTGLAGALVVKDRLLKILDERLQLPEYRQLKEVGVGISVGIGSLDASMKNAVDFLKAIDDSMYAHKLEQLPELTPEEQAEFGLAMHHLEKANVLPRDMPKYVQKYGALALAKAFEDFNEETETDQENQAGQADQ